ncbi:MAG: hypothetical protein WAL20_14875, partial [Rhodomicrobium sp.]
GVREPPVDQSQVLSRRERFKLALEKFWRAHIVDDDPYDALENERFEALIRARQAAQRRDAKDAADSEGFPLAA